MDPVTHLRQAADILRRDGWTRQAFVDATGAKCALGGMGLRELFLGDQLYEHHATLRALVFVLGCEVLHESSLRVAVMHYAAWITGWNDDPEQTKANVIATLELAAICEEQRRALAHTSDTRTEAA